MCVDCEVPILFLKKLLHKNCTPKGQTNYYNLNINYYNLNINVIPQLLTKIMKRKYSLDRIHR